MHVVYIITKLELGGAQKVCLALYSGLKQSNIHTTLISGNEGILVSTVQDDTSAILLPSLKREISLRGFIQEIKAFFSLITVLKNIRNKTAEPLIVHTHSTKAGILGRWAAFFAGVPTIIHTVHGFAFHEHQNKLLWLIIFCCEWATAFITDHFVVVSSNDQATGSKLLPWFKKNNTVIRAAAFTTPKPTFTRELRAFGDAERPCIIGTTSCFKPQKNLKDLIQIFSTLVATTSRNIRLEIIGDGQQRPELEKLVQDLRIADLVTFAGWQSDISPWLERWDIFALTSLWEGLPCAVIEARLFNLPVIAYNTGGIHDAIATDLNGALINQHDQKSFVEYVQKCLNDAAFYNRLAHHADDLEAFRIATMVNEHIRLYKKSSP